MNRRFLGISCAAVLSLALAGCGGGGSDSTTIPTGGSSTPTPTPPPPVASVTTTVVASFTAPWTLAFLPDGQMLVTERPPTTTVDDPTTPGTLWLVSTSGRVTGPITGLPDNVGLLDVKLSPGYATDHLVYFSYLERDTSAPRVGRNAADPASNPFGLAVVRATLTVTGGTARISGATTIWRQVPKIVSNPGSAEPGGRMAFSPDGAYLFIAAGDRQELDPTFVQSLDNMLGKIVRIRPDGSIPTDNPYVGTAGALMEIWSIGHRNQYGLAFSPAGDLWESEMGPKGGDELNLIQPGANYGWPFVSYGDNYDGSPITKPAAGDGYAASAFWWTPVIAPSEMIFYTGSVFGDWRGDIILSGLVSKGLVRVRLTGTTAREMQRIDLGARIRCVRQAPDGSLWVLEDEPGGRLLKLTPVFGS